MGRLGTCKRRLTRLVGVVVLVLCCAGAAAGAAAAASDFTWSGADTTTPGPNWSDPANWLGGVAPASASTIGTLTFPELTSSDCTSSSPVGTCFVSNNDLTNLTVDQLDFEDGSYDITGNGITLDGGLSAPGVVLALPIMLGATQTWDLTSDAELQLGASKQSTSTVSGDYSLSIDLGGGQLSADDVVQVGALSIDDGVIAADSGPLNANGNPVTLTDADMGMGYGPVSVGALSLVDSGVGPIAGPGGGALLHTTSATFDSGSSLGSPGGGLALTSTGPVDLGGASLYLDPPYYGGDPCVVVSGQGETSAVVSTTGVLTGTFGNAPNGGTVSDGCDDYRIDYNTTGSPQTVAATLLGIPSSTSLATVPASPNTNQTVTLNATITSSAMPGDLGGTNVDFEQGGQTIPGCGAVPITYVNPDSDYTASCQTSFAAGSSPIALSAVYTEGPGSTGTDDLTVGQDATTTTITGASDGAGMTYTATVTPADAGPVQPSGTVEFLDDGTAIGSCASQPLTAGSASSAATCTLSSAPAASDSITAAYGGDRNFTGSDSTPAQPATSPPAVPAEVPGSTAPKSVRLPSISITTPKSDATYRQGQIVDASYACTAPTGATLTSCAGSSPSRKPIDTAVAGRHTFTVTASDGSSATGSATSYTVVADPNLGGPTVSHGSIHGLAKSEAKLAFTATAGKDGPGLKRIVIAAPSAIGLSAGNGVIVTGPGGKPVKFTAKVSKGALTITLAKAASKVRVTIAKPAIAVTGALAARVAENKTKSVTFGVTLINAVQLKTRLALRVRAR